MNFKAGKMQHADLNIITSALHADTLAIVASELVRKAGTQLELNTEDFKISGMFLSSLPVSLVIAPISLLVVGSN